MEINRSNANAAIDRYIIGSAADEWKHEYIGDEAVPFCDIQNRRICSPVLPPNLDPTADMLIRAKNEHEAGHARLTPANKMDGWSALMKNLVNVLE